MSELQHRAPRTTIATATPLPGRTRREMLAELKRMQRRGEIGTVWEDVRTGEVTYQRLTEPRSRMPLYATLTASALGTLITVGVLAWHSRYVILAAAGAALLLWFAATRPSHRGVCPGLHCAGCRR